MRLCKVLLYRSANYGQYNTIIPRVQRRYFAARKRKDDPIEDNTNDEPQASDWEDAFTINSENKTIGTAVGDLPLSPVMDPSFWEARQRHSRPKPKAGRPQNSVERQLRANPFAAALATPIRMCAITQTRLPSFFLQQFKLVAHPETGAPWLIPYKDLPKENESAEEPDSQGALEAIDDTIQTNIEETEVKPSNPQEQEPTSTADERPRGPGSYVLARQDFLASFKRKQSGFESAPKRLTGGGGSLKYLANKVVWREDMDSYILQIMRQDIVNDILYLSRLCTEGGRYYIVKCYGWDDVKFKHKGAVLWFGPEGNEDSSNVPGQFATCETQKTGIQGETVYMSLAVHNMPMLLGEDEASRIQKEAGALKDGTLFMLAGRRTTKLQMKLWKLQGYMADYSGYTDFKFDQQRK
ncbi:uncharacterized protein F4822DRAFT_153712 [Hypoxylon trugodes]|uniref:uncharacterized protein n=1 Tax=Hypoxylon trugodes TaxID=326681 RepID=UPI00219EA658|nr:uncharacterized protein F4822DRAFT_153712 [Hypoxylon trugodes]KAI1390535.1 hypothetical protein F4822DRAFT_153712 [Hypoxylon trugodes]